MKMCSSSYPEKTARFLGLKGNNVKMWNVAWPCSKDDSSGKGQLVQCTHFKTPSSYGHSSSCDHDPFMILIFF